MLQRYKYCTILLASRMCVSGGSKPAILRHFFKLWIEILFFFACVAISLFLQKFETGCFFFDVMKRRNAKEEAPIAADKSETG